MSQPNSITLQQHLQQQQQQREHLENLERLENQQLEVQHQLQLQAASLGVANAEQCLLSGSYDLLDGRATAAQQFFNHIDLYAQEEQLLQQLSQQKLALSAYHFPSQSQSQSLSQRSVSSSSTSSSSAGSTVPTNYHHHPQQSQYNHNHHQHSQQHRHLQPHLSTHSNSVTHHKSPAASAPPTPPPALTSTSTNAAATAAAAATTLLNLNYNQTNNHHHHNQNQHYHQMDAQQQQQQQLNGNAIAAQTQAASVAGSTAAITTAGSGIGIGGGVGAGALTTIAVAGSGGVMPSSSSSSGAASHQQQHQHHHHQQQQQHGGGSTSPYKSSSSCWCFGESVCSGIEVEIENNNNNNHFHHGDSTYHMKILVPAVASGAIIGKGGETIASLQKDSGARVKMSKSHDFYPGTSERVCLITGSVEGIMTVLDFIMDKIREKPDLTTKIIDAESKQTQERDKQVKILVPNSTAGMIIGKGGAFIKQIKEESGSYVQISQKPKDVSLQERCITIIGDKENNKNACKMILSKIVEDPQSGTCLNVSYADVNGPVANFNPTGSPYATNQNAINSSTASLNSTLGTTIGSAPNTAGLLVNGTGINLSINLGSPNPAPNLAVATQVLEHIKVAMRGSGYSETATSEVCAALGVLAKYGVLGMGVGVTHSNGGHTTLGSYLGVSTLDQQNAANSAATSNMFGAVGQVNLEQYTAAAAVAAAAASRPTQSQLEAAAAAAQFDPFRHLSSAAAAQAATPVSLNNNSFGLTAATGTAAGNAQTLGAASAHALSGMSKSPTPGDLGAKDSKNVEIPEVIIGAILGPNGRSLVEIQHVSGANVQISKKGIFAPGSRNRIVTITGQPSAIAKAQFLIEQKINEEETKRARQIPLTTVVN